MTDTRLREAFERIYAVAEAHVPDPDELIACTDGGDYSLATDGDLVRAALAAQPAPASGGEPAVTAERIAPILCGHVDGCECEILDDRPHTPCIHCRMLAESIIIGLRHPPASGTGSEDTAPVSQEFACVCGHPTSRHRIRHSALEACYDCGCHLFRSPSDQGDPHA